MAEIRILGNTATITGTSFDDCKAEWNRVLNTVEKEMNTECGLRKWKFSTINKTKEKCIVIYELPKM